jgi:hypothetical protein
LLHTQFLNLSFTKQNQQNLFQQKPNITQNNKDLLFPLSSVTIIVAYLMKSGGMSLSEALQHVKNKRPQAAPNRCFIGQLEEFEKSLQGENCICLKYRQTSI